MKYYFSIDQNPSSPTYEKPTNVSRVDLDAKPIVEQSYTDKGWKDNPHLVRSISGVGGDGSQWQETTEAEANKFIAALASQDKPQLFLSRPKDKSLEAYRNWIEGIVKRVNPGAKSTMTDADWKKGWKEFWGESNKG